MTLQRRVRDALACDSPLEWRHCIPTLERGNERGAG